MPALSCENLIWNLGQGHGKLVYYSFVSEIWKPRFRGITECATDSLSF
jgi:hypothetical protein